MDQFNFCEEAQPSWKARRKDENSMKNKSISTEINDLTFTLNRKIGNSEEKERDKERAAPRNWSENRTACKKAKIREYASGYGEGRKKREKAEDRKKAEMESRDESEKRENPLIVNLTQSGSKSESSLYRSRRFFTFD
jgi:hypothetical protein